MVLPPLQKRALGPEGSNKGRVLTLWHACPLAGAAVCSRLANGNDRQSASADDGQQPIKSLTTSGELSLSYNCEPCVAARQHRVALSCPAPALAAPRHPRTRDRGGRGCQFPSLSIMAGISKCSAVAAEFLRKVAGVVLDTRIDFPDRQAPTREATPSVRCSVPAVAVRTRVPCVW